jgi:hypothetical protein
MEIWFWIMTGFSALLFLTTIGLTIAMIVVEKTKRKKEPTAYDLKKELKKVQGELKLERLKDELNKLKGDNK